MRARTLTPVLAAVTLAAALGVPVAPKAFSAEVTPDIAGGTRADQVYPFLVELALTGGPDGTVLHRCGASMLTDEWAVTAAHCVAAVDLGQLTARVGSDDRTRGGEVRAVSEKVVNPRWRTDGFHGDIALIRLSAPVTAPAIKLAAAPRDGAATRLVGWGYTCAANDGGKCPNPTYLRQVDTHISGTGDCSDIDGKTELCVGDPKGGTGPCAGDSGGPALVSAPHRSWRLIGVTSRSGHGEYECARGPAIYTSVPAYAPWVATVLAAHGTHLP